MKYIGIEYIYHKCGGLGDRLCGLVNIIMLSKILKKKFYIKWEETNNINKYLDYEKFNYYNLNIADLETIKKNYLDNKDTNLIKIIDEIKNIKNIDDIFDKDVLICYSNQDSNRFFIANEHINFTFDNYKKNIFNIFQSIYTKYLKPNKYILKKVNELVKNKDNIVGIQMRCGDCYMVKDNKHKIIHNEKDIYNILNSIQRSNPDKTVFITSDYEKVFDIAKELFNDIIYYDKKPVHCDMNDQDFIGKGDDPVDSDNVDKILIDHYILSNFCSKLYISGSNFGRTAALINKSEEIYNLFSKKKLNKVLLVSKLNKYNNLLKKYI